MSRCLSCAVLLAASTTASAQPGGASDFKVGRFDAISLASSDKIEVRSGNAYTVRATGDPAALSSLAIDVRGDTLYVGRTAGTHSDAGATIIVTLPALRAATVASSGTIEASRVGGTSFTATLAGSGAIRLPALHAKDVRLAVRGSGSISADGGADRLTIVMGGSGQVRAERLASDTLAVAMVGTGEVSANATRVARISAGGSGAVRVAGKPRCSVSNSGSARITCG